MAMPRGVSILVRLVIGASVAALGIDLLRQDFEFSGFALCMAGAVLAIPGTTAPLFRIIGVFLLAAVSVLVLWLIEVVSGDPTGFWDWFSEHWIWALLYASFNLLFFWFSLNDPLENRKL